jgi:hypothetical protein
MNVEIVDMSKIDFQAIQRLSYVSTVDWDIIHTCYSRSEQRWAGLVDGTIACLWGLIPPSLLSDQAYLWLMHTPLVENHKFRFIRHSQIQMKKMLELYPNIVGDCLISNRTGKKWLEWLGAKFTDPPDREGLVPFHIRAEANG